MIITLHACLSESCNCFILTWPPLSGCESPRSTHLSFSNPYKMINIYVVIMIDTTYNYRSKAKEVDWYLWKHTSIYNGLFVMASETVWKSSWSLVLTYVDTRRRHWLKLATGRLTRFPWNGPLFAYKMRYYMKKSNFFFLHVLIHFFFY